MLISVQLRHADDFLREPRTLTLTDKTIPKTKKKKGE
jgi:hypothetical protein